MSSSDGHLKREEDPKKREEEEAVATEQENVYAPAKKSALSRHIRRFWWLHLIILILIVLLVTLLIIFVAVGNIAQSKINSSTLTVDGILVTNTQTGSLTMSINSTIHADSSPHATIDGFLGDMYLEDLEPHTPFAQINFPQTVNNPVVAVNISQTVPVTDNLDALTTFNTWLLNNQTLRITIRGDTHVHVSGISHAYPVTYQKTVTLTGLNKFKGLAVTQSNVSIKGFDAAGDDFIGYTTIPNPSVVGFELGNTTFNNNLFGASIGNLTIANLTILPGNNNVSFVAKVDQTPVLSAVARQPYCQTGVVPFALIGQSVVNNGQPLPYFANAFQNLNSSVTVDIGADLKAIGLPVSCPSS